MVTLEQEATKLKASYDQKTQDLIKYKEELKVIEDKKAKGTKMLEGLSNEKVRWTKNDSELSEQLRSLSAYALKTAVMFVVAGNRTDDVRSEYCNVRDKVQQQLYTSQFADDAQKNGLRLSRQNLENISMLQLIQHTGFAGVVFSKVTDACGLMDYLRQKLKGS